MNSAYMTYCNNLAKLKVIANKKTMFLAHILYRMNWHKETRQYISTITAFDKREILKSIGAVSKNPIQLAGQYIHALTKAGLIKPLGGGGYLIDPDSYSGHKYVTSDLRLKNAMIYETRVFTDEGEGETQTYIVTEDGERIDL